jgi:hypothetical protein
MASRSSKSDSPVAAEEQLAEARGETGEEGTPLEKQAKEQKAQQSEELAAGKGAGSTEKDKLVKKGLVAAARRQPGLPSTRRRWTTCPSVPALTRWRVTSSRSTMTLTASRRA